MPAQYQEIQQTLDAYKSGLAPAIGLLSPDAQKDWNLSTGFQPYNLIPVALMLYPQLSPLRNMLPRTGGKGRKSEYKAVTAVNNTALNGFAAEGASGATVKTTTEDITATYRTMTLSDFVTFEQQWAGQGFLDSKGVAVVNLLRAMMIQEESNLLFGANSTASATEQAPGAVGAAPSLGTPTTTTTGGSIAASTAYYFKQTVVTAFGESTPSASSATVTTGTGSTNSITVTPVAPSGQPVIGYRIYASTTSGGTYYLIVPGTNTSNSPSSAVTPGGIACTTNGDAIVVTSIPGSGTNPPGSDGTAASTAWNGIYTQMWGGSGATLTNQAGALTTAGIDGVFKSLWNASRADPDNIFCNVQESIKLTSLTLGAGAPYYVVVNDQNAATGLFRVARLTNKATGSEVPVKVHPTLPQGTMLFLSTKLPGWYVPTDVPAVMDVNACQDYIEIDYPPVYNTTNGAQWTVEVRLFATPRLFVPGLQGALYGINNS